MKKIYLDNAATTYPKPRCVVDAVTNFMVSIGCSPGRGGYEGALKAGRLVYETRDIINRFFNGPSPDNVIFTENITASLNTVIKGMIKPGWHVITSSMEHNSVIRPLKRLQIESGVEVTIVKCRKDGTLNPKDLENAITDNTKAVILTHASNLTGTILPVEEIGKICKKHSLYFILDSAQTAGVLDIDFKSLNLDVLAFTGHKGLLGPQGTGGFIISDRANEITSPLMEGGTGSKSHMEVQPDFLPDKFESGTLNAPGIAGLNAGIKFIKDVGMVKIRTHEMGLTDMFIEGLKLIKGVDLYGPEDSRRQTSTIALNIGNMDPGEVSFLLDNKYGIMTRSGMHCTPLAHKTIGTFPRGAVRFSIGYFNTQEEIQYALDAIKNISN